MNLENTIEILTSFKPLSIFVYGSQANNTQNKQSDFEIGIIFKDNEYVHRAAIKAKINDDNFNVFPFKLSELQNYTIDTPFQKNIYIASLINGNATTVYGKKIIENLPSPTITNNDLLMDSCFNLGCALSAVKVYKTGNLELANELMYKSVFYATRNLIYLQCNKLISGYNNIYEEAKNLNLPYEFKELLNICQQLRNNKISDNINPGFYFRNVSYINHYVIPEIQSLTNNSIINN